MTDYTGLTTDSSDNLEMLINRLKMLRGDPNIWLRRYNVLSRHIASLTGNERILDRGECRFKEGHFPAIALYNPDTDITEAFIACEEDDHIKSVAMRYFWPGNHFQSSAREVFSERETTERSDL